VTGGVIFPELLSGREDEEALRPWTVREGSTMRGAASCNLNERVLEVPLGPGGLARVVRAHELMHARVSPHLHHLVRALDEVTPRALECAEELRVNALLARLRFDVALLKDGTEKLGGRRLAETEEWGEALCFFAAVIGTGAEKDYLSGIRQGNPTWLGALRAFRKRVVALLDELSTTALGATKLNQDDLPSGYAASTLVIARLLTQSMRARVPSTPDELRAFRRSLDIGGRRPPTGRFAELVFDASLARANRSRSSSIRRPRASTTGTVLRYPGRLVTDQHRRAFSHPARRHGGVVVIDQSGSMDIEPDALARLLRSAPEALVIGYSHRPGDLGATPNVWLLGERGKVATTLPSGNVGNGVDGPVLRWALAQCRVNESMVWITDGQVTDSHDHPDRSLTNECATLVRQHSIQLARDVDEAIKTLRLLGPRHRARWSRFGRVGLQLQETAKM
jgi:hypothetical protein